MPSPSILCYKATEKHILLTNGTAGDLLKYDLLFLGIRLDSGKQYSQVLERSFHVSMAALGTYVWSNNICVPVIDTVQKYCVNQMFKLHTKKCSIQFHSLRL